MEQRRRELDPNIYNSFEQLYYQIKRYQKAPSDTPGDVRVHRFED